MPTIKLIADSGSTKTDWCLLKDGAKKTFTTQGLSPYFVSKDNFINILEKSVRPLIPADEFIEISFYGTGCKNPENARMVTSSFSKVFPKLSIKVQTDLHAAAKALCGNTKGIACILGTGSNSCYFDGKKIIKNSPGLGFVLGDEGSGAYLGKKVVQQYLYNFLDADLRARFDAKFVTNSAEILHAVYTEPLPNRYLASFAIFLAENRGNTQVEQILKEGLNDFFTTHVVKYKESAKLPVHFTGSIAWGFRDVLKVLCREHSLLSGQIFKKPMTGLIKAHEMQ